MNTTIVRKPFPGTEIVAREAAAWLQDHVGESPWNAVLTAILKYDLGRFSYTDTFRGVLARLPRPEKRKEPEHLTFVSASAAAMEKIEDNALVLA